MLLDCLISFTREGQLALSRRPHLRFESGMGVSLLSEPGMHEVLTCDLTGRHARVVSFAMPILSGVEIECF